MAGSIHLDTKHSEAEKAAAFNQARSAMRRMDRYTPARPPHENEMARLVLMGMAARAKFAHLYAEHRDFDTQLRLSFRAFERYRRCVELLSGYPDPVEQAGFTVQKEPGIFQLVDKSQSIRFDVMHGKIGTKLLWEAARDAVVNFVYKWCMEVAGDRPKNFQVMYKSRGATMCAANIQGIMHPFIQRLSALSSFSHPATNYVIEKLLIRPPLPFGIRVPS